MQGRRDACEATEYWEPGETDADTWGIIGGSGVCGWLSDSNSCLAGMDLSADGENGNYSDVQWCAWFVLLGGFQKDAQLQASDQFDSSGDILGAVFSWKGSIIFRYTDPDRLEYGVSICCGAACWNSSQHGKNEKTLDSVQVAMHSSCG